ncbi:MAG: hypothetical protein IJU90_03545 [Bacteroidales bacterium]|nr:hypothetical protein [Bacteroidales bacterium]
MRKILLICVTMVLFFTACDPGGTEYCSIKNRSGHVFTVRTTGRTDGEPSYDNASRKEIIVAINEDKRCLTTGHLWDAEKEMAVMDWNEFLGDTVFITFDDGKEIVYLKSNGRYIYDYDNYRYSYENRDGWFGIKHYIEYGWLVYNVTEDDYKNAHRK